MTVTHRAAYVVVVIIAMLLGIVTLALVSVRQPLLFSGQARTARENTQLAFSIIGWILFFIVAILLLILFCACGDQHFGILIVCLVFCIIGFISYLIVTSLALQLFRDRTSVNTRPQDWINSAFWVCLCAMVMGIAYLFDDYY